MNILSTLFSGGVSKVIDSLGSAIDKLVTSDEEKKKLTVILQKEMNEFRTTQLEAVSNYDKEITKRHNHDMHSDSWLSKNIRPLTLAFMSIATMGLAYSSIFVLDKEDVVLVEPWITLFTVLMVTIYGFYFGGRSLEKAIPSIKQKIK